MPPQAFITRLPAEIFGTHLGYGFAGLGVNTAIGNFTQTISDLTFPGNLLGLLDWTRTYNSLSGTAGALGPGWTTQSPPGSMVRSPEYDDPDEPTGGELDGSPVPARVGAGDDDGDGFGDIFDFFP